jgi:hypothetical protein
LYINIYDNVGMEHFKAIISDNNKYQLIIGRMLHPKIKWHEDSR